MKSKIIFLSPFPTPENSKDGMISRIKDIDKLFEDLDRTYLTLSLKRNVKTHLKIGNVNVIEANVLLYFWYIVNLLFSHKYIYSHSIYNLRFIWPIVFFLKKKQTLILDVHGVVPEELRDFYKKKGSYFYYSIVEKFVFRRLNYAVFVTSAMSNYYKEKYTNLSYKQLIYYIVPNELKLVSSVDIKFLKLKNSKKINILYSGGIQPWQNIDLMLDVIKFNQNEKIHYTILTPDVEYFNSEIKKREINLDFVTVESKNPSDLWKSYLTADYAFILRDNNLVNNVACPTKLFEYLYYGLIPIVLTSNIGDFDLLGYKYLKLKKFNIEDLDKPNTINYSNIQVAMKMIDININGNPRRIIID